MARPKHGAVVLRITAVESLDGYRLRLTFDDGIVPEIDASFVLYGRLGEDLKDPERFRQVRVNPDARTIVWSNGLDPDPDVLHGDFESAQPQRRSKAGR